MHDALERAGRLTSLKRRWRRRLTCAHALAVCVRRVMLVGWGGNNGTTLTGGILANKK